MKRSFQKEWMDTGEYSQQLYRDSLYQLGRVGKLLGGDRATFSAIDPHHPLSILDVGCGGGYFTKRLSERYPEAEVVGVDISAEAITYAKEKHPSVTFLQCPAEELNRSFDVVTATLVCHHLTDDELVSFFTEMKKMAKKAVVINDLHRHFMAWASYALIAPPLFHNRMITHDGLLSIRRSFVKSDWKKLFKRAGIADYQIQWHFPFRWVVVL